MQLVYYSNSKLTTNTFGMRANEQSIYGFKDAND